LFEIIRLRGTAVALEAVELTLILTFAFYPSQRQAWVVIFKLLKLHLQFCCIAYELFTYLSATGHFN
jgi:hypothetical protein